MNAVDRNAIVIAFVMITVLFGLVPVPPESEKLIYLIVGILGGALTQK